MSLLERFPAYKVISSVIPNPLGPFKTRGGEGGKGKEKKLTHTADAFMVYNPVRTAYATTGCNTVSPRHADQPTDRTEKPGEEIHPPKPTRLAAKADCTGANYPSSQTICFHLILLTSKLGHILIGNKMYY